MAIYLPSSAEEEQLALDELTPREIVVELDKYVIGQKDAKRAVAIALRTKPHAACLVPERRAERTTEGGLDAAGGQAALSPKVAALREAGIRVSLFIAADPAQIKAAAALKAPVIEIHTGAYCNVATAARQRELAAIADAAALARRLGLEVHAGHGLDYGNVLPIAKISEIVELNIGHSIIARAVIVGIEQAVREMKELLNRVRES